MTNSDKKQDNQNNRTSRHCDQCSHGGQSDQVTNMEENQEIVVIPVDAGKDSLRAFKCNNFL